MIDSHQIESTLQWGGTVKISIQEWFDSFMKEYQTYLLSIVPKQVSCKFKLEFKKDDNNWRPASILSDHIHIARFGAKIWGSDDYNSRPYSVCVGWERIGFTRHKIKDEIYMHCQYHTSLYNEPCHGSSAMSRDVPAWMESYAKVEIDIEASRGNALGAQLNITEI